MAGPAVAVVESSARRCGAGANATVCRGLPATRLGSARSRERGRDRSEQAPVGVGELGPVDLAAQHA